MKLRTVIVTLEVETDIPLGLLRDKKYWTHGLHQIRVDDGSVHTVRQVRAQVAQPVVGPRKGDKPKRVRA